MRPTWAEVDLAALAANVMRLRAAVEGSVCAVVKADGYGHGAVPVARAALFGGAACLAVALVEEGQVLRDAGIEGDILLLSEPRSSELAAARTADLRPTLYTRAGIGVAGAVARAHGGAPWPVHLKVDTGMHRVGACLDAAAGLADLVAAEGGLVLEGLWTHCAVADDPADPFTAEQIARFDAAVAAIEARGHGPLLYHLANSAGGIAHPRARAGMVRAGIAIYGIQPSPHIRLPGLFQPVLTLRSEVTHVQTIAAGEGVSYGRRWRAERPTRVATVPIGYADGVRRDYGLRGGEVLVRGRRCAVVGVVTMDQLMIDCGAEPVDVADEVVIIGAQGDQRITAEEIATRLDTIPYEVVCAIGARVPRRYRGEP